MTTAISSSLHSFLFGFRRRRRRRRRKRGNIQGLLRTLSWKKTQKKDEPRKPLNRQSMLPYLWIYPYICGFFGFLRTFMDFFVDFCFLGISVDFFSKFGVKFEKWLFTQKII